MKVLEISFDSYLGESKPEGDTLDWLPIGRSLHPRLPRETYQKYQVGKLKALLKVLTGRYDCICLPAIHVDNRGDFPKAVRLAKMLFKWSATVKWISWLSAKSIRLFSKQWVVLDIHYGNYVSEEVLKLVKPDQYFKRNLLRPLKEDTRSSFHMLPMPMPVEAFDAYKDTAKSRDFFMAGTYETGLRKGLLALGEAMEAQGADIDILKSKVSREEFGERLSAARVCFAPQGVGFHTWRMYEAALSGAMCIINEPKEDILHYWEDGENCVMHGEDLNVIPEKIQLLLQDVGKLEKIASAGASMVRERHGQGAVSRYVWKQIKQ